MAENYSPEIAKAVENFLSENGWGYEPHDDYGRIQTDIKLNCKFRKADIDIIINEDSFLVYLILPMTADKEVQKEMIEFLTRVNYGLESCNFEMDFSDGEIRCKCFCNCAGTVPTNQQISNCIFFNTATVNNYGNGIAKILFGIGTPEEVYLECKKKHFKKRKKPRMKASKISLKKKPCPMKMMMDTIQMMFIKKEYI